MGQRFEIPDMSTLDEVLLEIRGKVDKSKGLYETSVNQLKDYLYEMNSSSTEDAGVSTLEIYKWFVAKEKAIYNALNMLRLTGQTFIGYMWVPSEKEAAASQKLS